MILENPHKKKRQISQVTKEEIETMTSDLAGTSTSPSGMLIIPPGAKPSTRQLRPTPPETAIGRDILKAHYEVLRAEKHAKYKDLQPCTASSRNCTINLDDTTIPGRPICSHMSTMTEPLSAYVDSYLKPIATQVQSYIRDTPDLIQNLSDLGPLNKDALLVSIDVKVLYTSIPTLQGIQACRNKLLNAGNQSCHTFVFGTHVIPD